MLSSQSDLRLLQSSRCSGKLEAGGGLKQGGTKQGGSKSHVMVWPVGASEHTRSWRASTQSTLLLKWIQESFAWQPSSALEWTTHIMRASLVTSLHDLLKSEKSGGVADQDFFESYFWLKWYYLVWLYKGNVRPFYRLLVFDSFKVISFSEGIYEV